MDAYSNENEDAIAALTRARAHAHTPQIHYRVERHQYEFTQSHSSVLNSKTGKGKLDC
jgi:hypothetical protein